MSSNKEIQPIETLGFKKIEHAISGLCVSGITLFLWKDNNDDPELKVECDRQELNMAFTKMLLLARHRGIVDEDKGMFVVGKHQVGDCEFSDPSVYIFIIYKTAPNYTKRSNN